MPKNKPLTDRQYKVLCAANDACGAANYLFEKEVAQLTKLGLVEPRNEFSVKATAAGRERWLKGF